MALDSGEPVQEAFVGVTAHEPPPSIESLAFAPGIPFGSGLRAAREFLGLSLQDIADITKIRRAYLGALEDMDIAQLPSRPFAIGYVRAYARALGLAEETAILRFKQDAPDKNEPLRAPVGVSKETDPRLTLVFIGGGIVLAAIVIWNVAQRTMRDSAAPPPVAINAPPTPPAPVASPDTPVALGQALPPPVEATIPAPYVTPGLPGGPEASAPAAPTAPRVLGARAAVYGAPAEESVVTLQAVRSVSLVVHNGAGPPIFVRELTKGETYRAPNLPGLTLDVSAPDAFDVFVGGEYRGALTTPVTALSALTR